MKAIGTKILRHSSKRVLYPSISICSKRSSDPQFYNGRFNDGRDINAMKPNITEMLYRLYYHDTNDTYYNKKLQLIPSKGDLDNRDLKCQKVSSFFSI